jgi:hypothetical protein
MQSVPFGAINVKYKEFQESANNHAEWGLADSCFQLWVQAISHPVLPEIRIRQFLEDDALIGTLDAGFIKAGQVTIWQKDQVGIGGRAFVYHQFLLPCFALVKG